MPTFLPQAYPLFVACAPWSDEPYDAPRCSVVGTNVRTARVVGWQVGPGALPVAERFGPVPSSWWITAEPAAIEQAADRMRETLARFASDHEDCQDATACQVNPDVSGTGWIRSITNPEDFERWLIDNPTPATSRCS
jgi:hypothetical protein